MLKTYPDFKALKNAVDAELMGPFSKLSPIEKDAQRAQGKAPSYEIKRVKGVAYVTINLAKTRRYEKKGIEWVFIEEVEGTVI